MLGGAAAIQDVDFAVEGDAGPFARALAAKLGGRVREHGRFGTATIELPRGGRCDVASTRCESYSRPGALPHVRPASMAEDLARRDFTVNAMAIALGPGRAVLLDPFGGRRDLASGCLRFLHPRSPCDDPTRAFRAARYANRLGFRVSRDSVAAIRRAIASGAFDAISGDRLRRELDLMFTEPDPAGAVSRLGSLGLIRVIGAGLAANTRTLDRLRRAEALVCGGALEPGSLLFLLAWAAGLRRRQLEGLADRLALDGEPGRSVRRWESTWRRLSALRRGRRPSGLRRLVSDLSAAEIGALAAGLDSRQAVRLCDAAFKPVPLSIRGLDLVRAGVAPGPCVGRALEATRAARLDGMIGPGEELNFALRRARRRECQP